MTPTSTLITGATVLTMVANSSATADAGGGESRPGSEAGVVGPFVGDVRIEGRRITHVVPAGSDSTAPPPSDRTIDAGGGVLLPGFVQPHIHLCQSLFRNLADDLSLIDWLEQRIWPMEGALDAEAMRASADLGLAELIGGGTTTILDMGGVRHTDAIGEAVTAAGSRAFIGKAMMDHGSGVPNAMREVTADSITEAQALQKRWHGAADGRIHYAYAPRFGPSCTPELLRSVSAICARDGLVIHTHCAESEGEIALVRRDYGMGNLEFLDQNGMTGARSVFAHMVHLSGDDLRIVENTHTGIAHCPSSNCKLASGIAPIPEYLRRGLKVGLGADGAPCNNTLDAFMEMRLAALIHKPRFGPTAMNAQTVLELATRRGAEVLGIDDQIGTIEPGKRADLLHLRLDRPYNGVTGDIFGQIVYTASRQNVVDVWCDGRRLVERGELTTLDDEAVVAHGREAARRTLNTL